MDEFVTNLVLPMYFIILGVNDEVRIYNFYFRSYKVFMKKNFIGCISSMRAKIPKIKNCERYTQILLRTPPHRDIFNDDVTLNKCRGKKEVFILQGRTHFSLLTKKISVITKLLLDVYMIIKMKNRQNNNNFLLTLKMIP